MGIILVVNPRMAGNRFEDILDRVGVSTRTEAASIALDATILRWS